jgi:hypothetical protein
VVAGALVWPLLAVVHEVTYLVASEDHPDGSRRLTVTLAPAALLVVLAVAALIVGRRDDPPAMLSVAEGPGWRSLARATGHTVGGTAAIIRFRPLRAALATAIVVSLIAVGTYLLPTGPSGDQLQILRVESPGLNRAAFAREGDVVVAASFAGARAWDPATGRPLTSPAGDSVTHVAAFSPAGDLLVTAGSEDGVQLWDPTAPDEAPHELPGYRPSGPNAALVSEIDVSPDGEVLALVTHDDNGSSAAVVDLWDPATREELGSLPAFPDGVSDLEFSPEGETLAVAHSAVDLYGLDDLERIDTVAGADEQVGLIAFSPDGDRLAVVAGFYGSLGTVELDDVADDGRPITFLPTADAVSGAMAFSPDGTMLAGGEGNDVWLRDATTGQPIVQLEGHDRDVEGLAFSPDGMLLASAAGDDTVRIWDVSGAHGDGDR